MHWAHRIKHTNTLDVVKIIIYLVLPIYGFHTVISVARKEGSGKRMLWIWKEDSGIKKEDSVITRTR